MLSRDEKNKISEEAERYEQKSAACIEALRVVQESRGWVSDDSVRDIAGFLEMTPDEVDSVATFYNLIFRRPVGKNVLFLCDSVSCWVMRGEALGEHLKKCFGVEVGGTTQDGTLTVLPIACLGACDRAPVAMLGRELLLDLSPEKLERILSEKERRSA